MVLNSRREKTVPGDWNKEEEDALAEKQEREVHLRKSPERSDLGIWEIHCHSMSLGHRVWLLQAASWLCLPGSLLTGPQSLLFPHSPQGMPRTKQRERWDGAEATALDPLLLSEHLGPEALLRHVAGAVSLAQPHRIQAVSRAVDLQCCDPWNTPFFPCLKEGYSHFWAVPLSS